MSQIRKLLESAKIAQGAIHHMSHDGSVRAVTPTPAASTAYLRLAELNLPQNLAKGPNHKIHCPLGVQAGKQTTFSAAILQNSRVALAGAHVIVVPVAPEPVGAVGAVYSRVSRFDVIEAAEFSKVPDGETLTPSTLPIQRAEVDMETIPAYGFQVELSRADQKKYDAEGLLSDAALLSLALGVARVADAALLGAIEESTAASGATQADVLSMAAAAGLAHAELRALVGTDATGAAVDQAGTLRAAGVAAELTPDAAGTYIGAFNRAAVAVVDDVRVTASRINVNGGLELTCWVNVQPLLPRPQAFLKLAA